MSTEMEWLLSVPIKLFVSFNTSLLYSACRVMSLIFRRLEPFEIFISVSQTAGAFIVIYASGFSAFHPLSDCICFQRGHTPRECSLSLLSTRLSLQERSLSFFSCLAVFLFLVSSFNIPHKVMCQLSMKLMFNLTGNNS